MGQLSVAQIAAIQRFRRVFSHIESDCTIAAWLTSEQQEALAEYRLAFGLVSKETWNTSQLEQQTTEQELALIREFKDRLDKECIGCEEGDVYITDLRLLQYLRARDHHLDKAHTMLLATLSWRKEHKPWQLENVISKTNKKCSDARIVGYDKKGRIVVYSSFANTYNRTPKEVQINVAATMEKAALCVNAGSPGSLIWVNNFGARHKNGFSWRDCNPAFFFSGIDIFANHYPECLQVMMIVDPPSIFFTMWSMLHPVLPAKTQQKAEFIDSRKEEKTREHFVEVFGEELAEMLIVQIKKDS